MPGDFVPHIRYMKEGFSKREEAEKFVRSISSKKNGKAVRYCYPELQLAGMGYHGFLAVYRYDLQDK